MSEYKLSDRIRSGTDIMQRIVGGERPALIELADEVAALEQRVGGCPVSKYPMAMFG